MNKTFKQTALALICSILLAGCQATSKIGESWDGATNQMGSWFGTVDRTEDLEGSFIAHLEKSGIEKATSPDPKELIAARKQENQNLRMANITTTDIPALKRYVSGILNKLQASWPGGKHDIEVAFISKDEVSMQTLPSGTLIIPIGLFKHIKSEDELAAALAHELSHILLEHHGKDLIQKVQSKAFQVAEFYVLARGGENAKQDYATVKLVDWSAQTAFFPHWNRAQENEADILGTDLLIKAGYNADAMGTIINVIGHAAQTKAKFVAKQVIKKKEGSNGAVNLNFDVEQLIANIQGQLEEDFGHQYDSSIERRKHVRSYIRATYKDRKRKKLTTYPFKKALATSSTKQRLYIFNRAFKADIALAEGKPNLAAKYGKSALSGVGSSDPFVRYLMFQTRTEQKQANSAAINLNKAYRSGRAGYRVYIEQYHQTFNRKDYKKAYSVLEEINKEFNNPDSILPELIKVSILLKKPTDALKVRCTASLNVSIIQKCSAAETLATSG